MIIIKTITGNILFKTDTETLKLAIELAVNQKINLDGVYLEGASLNGVYLEGASLNGAYLDGAKEYRNSHQIFFELIRREKIDVFDDKEWQIIGQLSIHLPCWDTIKNRFPTIGSIFKKVADKGFDEYLKYWESINK